MSSPMAAPDVLNREYLSIRGKILELAAALDRIQRSHGSVEGDSRLALVHEALDVVRDQRGNRAEEIQLIFSRSYEDDWREKFGL